MDKDKFEQAGIDKEKARKFNAGLREYVDDNPVMNAYKWLTKKEKKEKSEQDSES